MSDPSDNRFYREPEPVETRTVHVHLADATRTESVPPIIIRVGKPLPRDIDPDDFYQLASNDAFAIASALYDALPGATQDALLRELLLRKASQLRVPMAPVKEETPKHARPLVPGVEDPAAVRADLAANGHGHVVPTATGRLCRCGGPGLCRKCREDQERLDVAEKGEPRP